VTQEGLAGKDSEAKSCSTAFVSFNHRRGVSRTQESCSAIIAAQLAKAGAKEAAQLS
jgi:hypothetical protein